LLEDSTGDPVIWKARMTACALALVSLTTLPSCSREANSKVAPFVRASHWHAALGVYDCDHWTGDSLGPGLWHWPVETPDHRPGRAYDHSQYAGLHSHDDGLIHVEPLPNDESGRRATIGRYFDFGGWHVSSEGFNFLGSSAKNGDDCNGQVGRLTWKVAKWKAEQPDQYVVMQVDPAAYRLHNDDVIVIAFLPVGESISRLGDPPSLVNLPDAISNRRP
jgi:hypothetical protein